MNVTILAANGQIAHLVEERLLTEPTFKDIQLTLMLRHPERLSELNDNPRVTLLDGDLTNPTDVIQATKDADLINIGRKSRDFSHGMDRPLLSPFMGLFVCFCIFLVIDIFLDNFFAHIAQCTHIVTRRPKMTAPILATSYFWMIL